MPPKSGRGAARKHQQRRRTHNLGGCSTCRRRHVKCDRTQPQCTTCHNARLTCEGFLSPIRWASLSYPPTRNSRAQDDANLSRPSSGSSNYLAIHNYTSLYAAHPGEPQRDGELSALSLDNTLAEGSDVNQALINPSAPDIDVHISFDSNDSELPYHPSASSLTDFESLFDTSSGLVWNDLFDPTFDPSITISQDPTYQESLSSPAIAMNQPQGRRSTPPQEQSRAEHSIESTTTAIDSQPPPCAMKEIDESELLEDAGTLLKHFRDVVVPQFSPLPTNSKCPWEVLNWNAAVRSLADMTYLESSDVRHANKANLFAILGCAAHDIAKTHVAAGLISSEKGTRILEYASKRAKSHMQESLSLETSGSSKAKYKDQLMAIFSLIALATLCGNATDARCYLIDAERLLRLRGLAKREVSRKVRLLHHVYTWLRIIGESTFILHDHHSSGLQGMIEKTFKSNYGAPSTLPLLEEQITTGIECVQLDDFLRVKSYGTDCEDDVDTLKDQESGLRDIHLEDSRPWSNTLYMDIYGIPEIWLSLVSQTTRVANIVDFIGRASVNVPRTFTESLHRKITRLEHMICSFASQQSILMAPLPPHQGPHQSSTATSKSSPASRAMLRALISALVILFYRRIHNVHPWILQTHVNDVITALNDFDLMGDADSINTPGTPWPAFVAGCEAISSTSREWLMGWMQKGANQSTFNGYTSSQHVMRQVWERRDSAGKCGVLNSQTGSDSRSGEVYSWVDVLKERKLWLMLY
ncbi:hypothetical protein P153DRAFT_361492 [Dothidotthia symphoricarpi CBS 119687]|uniref:Zn(2)-C6 fungal-type domain-containing protein n=1 Tax=Dothidotthia symphoricarpi CBS 119687 TaxID=1392245 RepID=A0A6A5ZW73_9PLEO|nr:uncharacterized protein P153DRAFT_361492 [Dothidotthia symphoricarpi CBS 119687]KAF2123840.1 hypothetical protein P153DRAFT_361492 [Dothidotthia symphoricarpi CBS 119687]